MGSVLSLQTLLNMSGSCNNPRWDPRQTLPFLFSVQGCVGITLWPWWAPSILLLEPLKLVRSGAQEPPSRGAAVCSSWGGFQAGPRNFRPGTQGKPLAGLAPAPLAWPPSWALVLLAGAGEIPLGILPALLLAQGPSS